MVLVHLLLSFFLINFTFSKQFYDPSPCSSDTFLLGSRYMCNGVLRSCNTFLAFRSRQGSNTASEISSLFNKKPDQVLSHNNLMDPSQIIEKDREVLIPIECNCVSGYFQSNVSYLVPVGTSYETISCNVFEGLVKSKTLAEENAFGEDDLQVGVKLTVPLKCACPDANDTNNGFQYLVTYPIMESDRTLIISEKFGINSDDIWAANTLDPFSAFFPGSTILVPLRTVPVINHSVIDPSNQPPGFVPIIIVDRNETDTSRQFSSAVVVPSVGVSVAFAALVGLGFYCRARYRCKDETLGLSSAGSSTVLCLSPDIVAGFSKYSLISYSVEELSEATQGFSNDTKLGASVHIGSIGGTKFVIKKIGLGDACRTVSIHAKINHTNIVSLQGVCYGDGELSPSYLVFEFARNGCLRDCLRSASNALSWHRRMQIALDVAVGLHYIHHCTVPSYIHMNINSKNILITKDWRAKIANLGAGSVIDSLKERNDIVITVEGWIAQEFRNQGSVSTKVDVFAFGVVLFELISGKEVKGRRSITKSLGFLGGGGSGSGCFEELEGFMDPVLKDYLIGEVLCLTVLAKACVEDDPLLRPSMDDILKILARMAH